ncbi:MAG: efflux RND transporter periplasmic adaptor subunit [Clostridiales bacterium]|nr:efflux RND transporter periplasmic adaptor subunit [Candidatus Blautia equi]
MSVWKKLLAVTLTVAVVGASGAGALNYIKKSREVEVLVVPVSSLASDYYSEDTVIEGNITTNVMQNVRIDKDMIVDEMYVFEGDTVSKGDKLVSFDMTLVEMELNIAKLKHQLIENDYEKAMKRLASLKNGGPIVDPEDESFYNMGDSLDSISGSIRGSNLAVAAIFYPALIVHAADFAEDFANDNYYEPDGSRDAEYIVDMGDDEPSHNQPTGGDGEFAGEEDYQDIYNQNPDIQPGENDQPQTPQEPSGDTSGDDFMDVDDFHEEWEMNPSGEPNEDFYQTDLVFLERLDGTTVPVTGTGTEEDPFIFLCSSEADSIVATGYFLNLMAGYNAQGTELLHEGGFWYQLEFHDNDEVADTENRMESCYGYFLVNGGLLEEPVYPLAEMEYHKEEAIPTRPEEPDIPPFDGGGGGMGGDEPTITRQEAIRQQESRVNSLKIDVEESSMNIAKLERKVKNQVVYARLDGIVANTGDSGNGNLLTVKSKQGYYVTGSISEMLLDQVEPGTVLDCMSYQYGRFDATVMSVSDYPMEGNEFGYYGESNPNVSNYTFSASIDDTSLQVSDGDWLQIKLKNSADEKNKLVISKAFVRSENGKSYVYKEKDGVLQKTYIKVGGNVDYGYSVIVQAGLSRKDYIAFPYGKAVQDGVKTREGSVDELYNY